MTARLIRVSSRALGPRRTIRVYIHDTVADLRAAATRFSPTEDFSSAAGVTHSEFSHRVDADGITTLIRSLVIVRLHRNSLGSEVIAHEISHAASAIYGSTLAPDTLAADVLHAANEPLAYLTGELTRSLVDRLYALGYYGES